jgi:hypothetical protein
VCKNKTLAFIYSIFSWALSTLSVVIFKWINNSVYVLFYRNLSEKFTDHLKIVPPSYFGVDYIQVVNFGVDYLQVENIGVDYLQVEKLGGDYLQERMLIVLIILN